MTRQAFETLYGKSLGDSIETTQSHVSLPCRCGGLHCPGWNRLNQEEAQEQVEIDADTAKHEELNKR